VTVAASGEPALDIRAGIDWSLVPGGVPGSRGLSSIEDNLAVTVVDVTTINVDSGGPIPVSGTQGDAVFTFTVPEGSPTIDDLDVRFSAAHTWDADLDVSLTSPTGAELELFSDVGGSGNNFQDTVLDDEAITSIALGANPFEGRFQPERSEGLAVFDGQVSEGTWTLTVTDDANNDSGTLFAAGETAPWGTAVGTQLLIGRIAGIGPGQVITSPESTTAEILTGTLTNSGGTVVLSNRFLPNGVLSAGDIQVGDIDTSIIVTEEIANTLLLGGDVTIEARNLVNLTSNREINTATGDLTIYAGDAVTLGRNSNINTDIGNVTINAGDAVTLSNNSNINTDIGNVTINAGDAVTLSNNSNINTETGAVNFNASRNILLRFDSGITSTAGDITLNTNIAGSESSNFQFIEFTNASITTASGAVQLTNLGEQIGGTTDALQGGTTDAPQIVPDLTLGSEASVLNLNGRVNNQLVALIEGGATRGNALFHSFEQFNVGEGQRVYFANPNGITNILGRVTGTDGSDILGTLGVDGGANLFLLNPNGILFGPDARLDISGSFTASTAERFIFADGAEFSAVNPKVVPLLTVNNVNPRLGYGVNEATMIVASELVVGEDLRLGAHRLEIEGELQARRDMVLQGSERILSGGNYTVGGYWFTEDLAGNGVDFVVPHSNVIWADGDVSLNGDYTGQSLYVLAGGSVAVADGVDEIQVTGGTVESVSPTVSDGMGGTQTITVSSDGQARLDIRSGVDWAELGGNPGNSAPGMLGVTFADATSGGIDLTGVDIRNRGGDVVLMSQVEAGSSLGQGDIAVKGIDTSMEEGDGGNISLSTITGDISSTGPLNSYSYSYSESLISGKGGNIGLSTVIGDITTGVLNSWSFSALSLSSSASGTFVGEAGGDITLSTVTGNISTETLDSSFTLLRPLSGDGVVAADGGNIVFSTITGHISTGSLNSSSFIGSTTDVEAGDGGGIALSTRTGNISTRSLDSPSFSGSFSNDVVARDGRNDILGIISYLAPDEGPSQNRRTILITTLLDDVAAASSGSLSLAPSGDVAGGRWRGCCFLHDHREYCDWLC
jgi:filamentous hemagglutinin family protein